MIDVVVLTHNEILNLEDCLASLPDGVRCHIVDSGSRDGTLQKARMASCEVYEHAFTGFGAQRNWALDHCRLEGDWVLFLDADERWTPEFGNAIEEAIRLADDRGEVGFYCCWKLMLWGRWLKRSDAYPRWQLRLLKRGKVRFVDFGHGQKEGEVDGKLGYIREPYLHEAFNKGWEDWLAKHNRYSTQEAQARLQHQPVWQGFLVMHRSLQILTIKSSLGRSLIYPFLRFFHAFILRGGFLEGLAGWMHCMNVFLYEYMVQLKIREIYWREREGTTRS